MRKILFVIMLIVLGIGAWYVMTREEIQYDDPIQDSVLTSAHADLYPEGTEFEFFGSIDMPEDRYYMFFISQYLNPDNKRLTKRLIVLDGRQYIGYYALDTLPEFIEDTSILFPCDVDGIDMCDGSENMITFTEEGPPAEVLYDGRFHIFDFVE